jgi:hypothetical protein
MEEFFPENADPADQISFCHILPPTNNNLSPSSLEQEISEFCELNVSDNVNNINDTKTTYGGLLVTMYKTVLGIYKIFF